MGYVRVYEPGDELELAPRLRGADLRELQASTTLTPVDCLRAGAECSVPACTIIDNSGAIAGMFGVNLDGRVWLLGTEAMTKGSLGRQFIHQCRAYVKTLQRLYPLLYNQIDERNTVHIRWLKWMAFTFIRRIPSYGPQGFLS